MGRCKQAAHCGNPAWCKTTGKCLKAEPAPVVYPHHCAPEDVAALVQRLEALADPAQQPTPSYENTDWRTLAGVTARVIKYLSGHDWRHGA